MKIVIINNLYGKYARGGAERVVEIIADELIKYGHEVIVISTKPFNISDFRFQISDLRTKTFFSWNIISYYNLNKLPKVFRVFWHLINIFNIQSYFKIKKILKREQPDIVMTHNLTGVGFLTALAIKKLKIKHIHTLHDIQLIHPSGLMNVGEEKKIDSLFAKIYQYINKKLFNSVDVVISPSEWLLGEHVKRGFFKNSKKEIIANPKPSCHPDHSEEKIRDSDDWTRDDKSFIFLYVGQIEKHKGVELLIETFAKLARQNYMLKIIGDGRAAGPLQREWSNRSSVEFLGKKTSEEVKKLMQKANCLIVPSLCYENQPTVIIEAQQNNLPVIASNIGGIPEMLDKEFLFKAGDSESLKNRMQWIVDNYKSIKVASGQTDNAKYLSSKRYIDKILSL
ncbi:hypothetical protein COT95_01625 [Candidatus Falkowbacteria bacterium CG10_big_fil_rev_8_21_14_0_10_37_6]|uniref:Glycosyltransferase subfamily 4-like N-terminal domain-containing protein n=1 Tax=Candidatus Falkowbacteria bacterium CG10_big_fil_rev_8_21_14_0_10_37_6 TaxID=1974563 RepID=A0A2H0V765_9BACT|nr:MAG: hypothetical protein COT95_01625 [Candidatus Falkowbacteria bacterium CG10_big_fil_rev_8_21_14_0_10_37_6]